MTQRQQANGNGSAKRPAKQRRARAKTRQRTAQRIKAPATRNAAKGAGSAPAPVESATVVPQDRDAFRIELARRMFTKVRNWERCREPLCRRAHRCAGRTLRCARDTARPPGPKDDAAIAHFRKMLQRAAEKLEGR